LQPIAAPQRRPGQIEGIQNMEQDYEENVYWLQQKPLLHERISSRSTKHKARITVIGGLRPPDFQLCASTKAFFVIFVVFDN
jgi:hypothetical protein